MNKRGSDVRISNQDASITWSALFVGLALAASKKIKLNGRKTVYYRGAYQKKGDPKDALNSSGGQADGRQNLSYTHNSDDR
jgi:hypothetical protein